jgi:hypothetical protein
MIIIQIAIAESEARRVWATTFPFDSWQAREKLKQKFCWIRVTHFLCVLFEWKIAWMKIGSWVFCSAQHRNFGNLCGPQLPKERMRRHRKTHTQCQFVSWLVVEFIELSGRQQKNLKNCCTFFFSFQIKNSFFLDLIKKRSPFNIRLARCKKFSLSIFSPFRWSFH